MDKKIQEEGRILTETRMVALGKKKDDGVASVEIETAHPSYLGSQDTPMSAASKASFGSVSRIRR